MLLGAAERFLSLVPRDAGRGAGASCWTASPVSNRLERVELAAGRRQVADRRRGRARAGLRRERRGLGRHPHRRRRAAPRARWCRRERRRWWRGCPTWPSRRLSRSTCELVETAGERALPRRHHPPARLRAGPPLPGRAARLRRSPQPDGAGRRRALPAATSGSPTTASSSWPSTTAARPAAAAPGSGPSRARFGDVPLDDQVAGLQALGARFPELDLERVGVYGWSFGGYLAALAVLRRPDVFKVAVAGAPVVDWLRLRHALHRALPRSARGQTPRPTERQPAHLRRPSCDRPLLLDPRHRRRQRLLLPLAQAGRRPVAGGPPLRLPAAAGVTHQIGDAIVREKVWRRVADFLLAELATPSRASPSVRLRANSPELEF